MCEFQYLKSTAGRPFIVRSLLKTLSDWCKTFTDFADLRHNVTNTTTNTWVAVVRQLSPGMRVNTSYIVNSTRGTSLFWALVNSLARCSTDFARAALGFESFCGVKSKETVGNSSVERFKSYFGSQISSQSLNEIHIYRLQPKSATKGELHGFLIVFVFEFSRVGACCRPLTAVWPSFPVNVNVSLAPILARQSYVLTTQRSQIAFPPLQWVSFSVLLGPPVAWLTRPPGLRPRRHFVGLFTICNLWCRLKTIKDKNIWHKSPFVADFGCTIGR